eukprot:3957615-Pleurochrysis_carterae.AAC.2
MRRRREDTRSVVAPAPAASGLAWCMPRRLLPGASLCDLDGAVTGTASAAAAMSSQCSATQQLACGVMATPFTTLRRNTARSTPAGRAPMMTRRKGCMPI